MNERLLHLHNQARECYFADEFLDMPRKQVERLILAKFAELIVRECIGVVEGGSFLHDQAPTAIFARECSAAIKRHFGVEE
jgi:hypothetical protein